MKSMGLQYGDNQSSVASPRDQLPQGVLAELVMRLVTYRKIACFFVTTQVLPVASENIWRTTCSDLR